ncbi:MAG: protein kinase [Planctomycetes bacterium]|nr:protein kinase [Planctomycetota bacterium]
MTPPRLGELAVQAGLVDARKLDDALRLQRERAARGDVRRLGELLVERFGLKRPSVRELLGRQGVIPALCLLCRARFNALGFRGGRGCLRCGRRLEPAPADGSLAVEDAISDPGPAGDALLAEHRRALPTVGRYPVLGELGRGGMGVVYKAWAPDLGRPVALKCMLDPDRAGYEDVTRFRREAQLTCSLRHPGFVRGVGFEQAGQVGVAVMEYLEGVGLEVLLPAGALTLEQVVRLGARVAHALHHAHQAGLVHRDVKPANVILCRDGRPVLVDLGIAKDSGESVSLTLEGQVLGSIAYMAPEYLQGGVQALGPSCDVYALGVILYDALTDGAHPFGDPRDEEALVQAIVRDAPTPAASRLPGLPRALAAVVDRAVAKTPDARYPTAQALARDLDLFAATLGFPPDGGLTPQEVEAAFVRAGQALSKGTRLSIV